MEFNYTSVDKEQLEKDIDAVREQIGEPNEDDFRHLKKMELWGRICAFLGYATAWILPFNPFSAMLMGLANVSRWANVTHPELRSFSHR